MAGAQDDAAAMNWTQTPTLGTPAATDGARGTPASRQGRTGGGARTPTMNTTVGGGAAGGRTPSNDINGTGADDDALRAMEKPSDERVGEAVRRSFLNFLNDFALSDQQDDGGARVRGTSESGEPSSERRGTPAGGAR